MTLTGNLISQVVGRSFGLNAEKLIHWLEERFTDHSQALPKALAHANDCAWHAVGLALCGDSFFDWFKDVLRSRDLTVIRDEIRGFLEVTPTGLEDSPPAVRVRAWKEWQLLRKAGRLSIDGISAKEVAGPAPAMQRYGDPAGLATGVQQAVRDIAAQLQAEAPNLAVVLALTPPEGGVPLLAATFTFFFRREIETKPEVYRGLSFELLQNSQESLRALTARQAAGFARLEHTMQDRAEGILGQLDALFEALDQGFGGLGGKLDDLCRKLDGAEKGVGSLFGGVSEGQEVSRTRRKDSRPLFPATRC